MKVKINKTTKVEGTINISGSKNTALPIICAALLTDKKVTLNNIPNITDVLNLIKIVKEIGCKVKYNQKNKQLQIKARRFNTTIIQEEILKLRGAYYLIGISLARYNKCLTLMPGGCNFTNRPINYHLKAFLRLGFKTIINGPIIKIEKVDVPKESIDFEKPSLGATINALLALSKINKEIIIKNPSLEPEVLEVIKFLRILGKQILIKNNQIICDGSIENKKIEFSIIGDRIEAGSYLLLATSIPNSHLTLINSPIIYMNNIIKVIKKMGQEIKVTNNIIEIKSCNLIKPLNLIINEYPSFPTDLQQIISSVLLFASSNSTIKDNIYKDRISHIEELKKLKAKIEFENGIINIYPSTLEKNTVICRDLRCAFSLIVAATHIDECFIDCFEIIFRGYEDIIEKLKKINVKINII